jgi:uncharacterized damage-inducible protein DinB
MIEHVADFIRYFDSIRRLTLQFARTVPADRRDWAPLAGEFTCGDLIRHLTAAEEMFTGAVLTGRWRYPGHTAAAGDTLEDLLARLESGHAATMARLGTLPDAALLAPCPTLDGPPTKTWRLLMALVEHEIHHRSQLAMYLTLMGVPPPHIYGLGVEDVIARATG